MDTNNEAKYWKKSNSKSVKCLLCPHECNIQEGKQGFCRVRENENGILITRVYGKIIAKNLDPIEKKPFYHFFPGRKILSVGTPGCNLRCFYCQNYSISQSGTDATAGIKDISPKELIQEALKISNNLGVAFTYNEPVVYYEYMYDTAVLAREKELKTAMVTNGYISMAPLRDILPYIDAFNVDLKAFSDNFYRKHTRSTIEPVKSSLKQIKNFGSHLEITYLIIPGLNDSEEEFRKMTSWISENLGDTQVLHLSRYFPNYHSEIAPTPMSAMEKFYTIAGETLKYVYSGNIQTKKEQNTYCQCCGKQVIVRDGYEVTSHLGGDGKCPACGTKILNYP